MLNIHLSPSFYALLSDPFILVSKRILLVSFHSRFFDLIEDESETYIDLVDTAVPIEATSRLSFRIKTIQRFLRVSSLVNTCQLKCACRLLVTRQHSTQKLVFGMIIPDPEHWRLSLKGRDYHGIIAPQTPYKSHNAKRGWFVFGFWRHHAMGLFFDSFCWILKSSIRSRVLPAKSPLPIKSLNSISVAAIDHPCCSNSFWETQYSNRPVFSNCWIRFVHSPLAFHL